MKIDHHPMKDSNLHWLGSIPSHWRLSRAKFSFLQTNDRGNQSPVLLAASQKHGICPQEMLDGVVKVSENVDIQNFKTVHKDDFVISLRSFQGGFEHSAYEGVCSPAYQVFHATKNYNVYYLKWLFKDSMFVDEMNSLAVGIRQGRTIKYEDFANSFLPIPPLKEQAAIAAYLDDRCAQIDAIIEETKASIEEYKQWKDSVISETVTKGIHANTKMKDSGIEWVGQIPISWRITNTIRCLSMPITDGPHTTPTLYDSGIPFISAEAVSNGNGRIDFSHMRGRISEEFYEECCKKYIPRRSDIYMIKSGATTGRVAIVDTDDIFTIWSPLAVFRANTERIIPMYLFYALQSEYYQKQVELGWTYGTQQNIGMRTLECLKLCIPPLDEQHEIVSFLEEKCKNIDEIINEKEIMISDLESYKRSLIYEAVTGKRKVV